MKKILMLYLFVHAALLSGAQNWSVSSNLAESARLATLNIEIGKGISRHWSISVAGKYNPFVFSLPDSDMVVQDKKRSVAASLRYWPWHIFSGWWMAPGLRYLEYSTSGPRSDETIEGDRIGAGLSGGYSVMLGSHLNLDLGLGLWGGYDKSVRYSCPECGRKTGEHGGGFLAPDELILSLCYVF